MRKLLTFLIALASIVFAVGSPVKAQYGCKSFGYQGGNGCNSAIASPPPSGPVLTYIGTNTPTYISNVGTVSSANIGTAASNRLVVVVFYDLNQNASAMVSIGGVSATINAISNTPNLTTGIASLVVPTGTTVSIAVTFSSSAGFGAFDVYTITGLSSTTPVGSGTDNASSSGTATTSGTTLATSSGGVVVVGSQQYGGGSATSDTISGTESYNPDHPSFVPSGGFSRNTTASAQATATSASSSVTATWNGASYVTMAAASWR